MKKIISIFLLIGLLFVTSCTMPFQKEDKKVSKEPIISTGSIDNTKVDIETKTGSVNENSNTGSIIVDSYGTGSIEDEITKELEKEVLEIVSIELEEETDIVDLKEIKKKETLKEKLKRLKREKLEKKELEKTKTGSIIE